MNCLWCPDCLGDVAALFRESPHIAPALEETHASQATYALVPPTALCFTLWCLPRCALLPHVANVCLVSWLHIHAVHLVMWTFDISSCGGIQSTTCLACSLFKQWSPAPLASSAVLSSAALCCGRGLSTTPMSSILHTWCCCVAAHYMQVYNFLCFAKSLCMFLDCCGRHLSTTT